MAPDLKSAIGAIEELLATEAREDQVLAGVRARLAELREEYARDASAFTPEHVERLRRFSAMERALDAFVTLRADLEELDDPEDLAEAIGLLTHIARTLGTSLVRQRALKEIRELEERRPAIEARDADRDEVADAARFNALARHPPTCPASRHRMRLVRSSRGGAPYWACSAYPRCEHRQWLEGDERAFLDGDRAAAGRLEARWQREELMR